MAITSERLNQTFSEGRAQEIYQEIKANGDFLGFAQRYAFDTDYRVARTALWGLTKAKDEELSELKVIYNELIDQAMQTENSSVRRLTLNIIEKLKMDEDDLRTDFLDFCFNAMLSNEPIGVKSLAIKLTYAQSKFYPELLEEFNTALQMMEPEVLPAALKHIRGKMLKK